MTPSRPLPCLPFPARGPLALLVLAMLLGVSERGIAPAAAQDTHRPPVIIDGMDLTEEVYEEPPHDIEPHLTPDYREQMRDIIATLAEHGKTYGKGFEVLVRGGAFLATMAQRERNLALLKLPPGQPLNESLMLPIGSAHRRFVRDIAGVVLDRQYCDSINPESGESLKRLKDLGLAVLTLEPCKDVETATKAWEQSLKDGVMMSVGTDPRQRYDTIPPIRPPFENSNNIDSLGKARNWLAVLSSRPYDLAHDWVAALSRTNYDLLVIDPFFNENEPLTAKQVSMLKYKQTGATRRVMARLTIGLASDTRWYWQPEWKLGNPPFLTAYVPHLDGVYWVDYNDPAWLEIIGKAFAELITLGYDGVMLDGVSVVWREEALTPL